MIGWCLGCLCAFPPRPPKGPRRPPAHVGGEFLRHRIDTPCAARTAAPDAKQRQPPARPKPMAGDRLVAIFGTGRHMTAGVSDQAGERQLVESDKAHAEQAAGSLGERTRPVARAGLMAGLPSGMAASGGITHLSRPPRQPRPSPRSGRGNPPPPRRSAWSRRGGPCSP